ncbi:hypothetical protein BVW01_23530, partial [Mycobacterium tuberculosis]
AAETTQRVFGDADAVSVGDYHIPKMIGWTLAGRPVDDAGMRPRPHNACSVTPTPCRSATTTFRR